MSQFFYFVPVLNLEQFVGWKWDAAQAALSQNESTHALSLCVIETVAPLRKNQTAEEQEAKLGDWRVLHVQLTENRIKVVIAREQIVD